MIPNPFTEYDMSRLQSGRLLRLSAPLGDKACVAVQLDGEESISSCYFFDICILSDDVELNARKVINKPLSVAIHYGRQIRWVHGIISQLTKGQYLVGYKNSRQRYYTVRLVPELWRLKQTKDCRIFQGKTVFQIVSEILRKNVIKFKYEIWIENHQALDYVVQYNESTYDFITRLLFDAGIHFYFSMDETSHTLHLADQPLSPPRLASKEALHYSDKGDKDSEIQGWVRHEHLITETILSNDYNPLSAEERLMDSVTLDGDKGGVSIYGSETYYNQSGAKEPIDAELRTKQFARRIEQSGLQIEGRSQRCLFSAGYQFKLATHPDPSELGDYRITHVKHSASDIEIYDAKKNKNDTNYQNTFMALPVDFYYQPVTTTEKPKIYSHLPAIVVYDDSEQTRKTPSILADQHGRVRVRFFWDRRGESSCWLRVSQPWIGGGGKWGMHFIPRTGDEVLVGFLDGDPDQPFIVGALPNSDNQPLYNCGKIAQEAKSAIRSLSLAGNKQHEILFDDTANKEVLALTSDKKIILSVAESSITLTPENITLQIGGSKINMTASEITIDSDKSDDE